MTKHYCDRCQHEHARARLRQVKIPKLDVANDYDEHELCDKCFRALQHFFDPLPQEAP